MPHHLTAADKHAPTPIGQSPWQRLQLDDGLGECFTDHLRFGDGLAVAHISYSPRHDLVETSRLERERCLTLAIALEGHSSTTGADGRCVDFIAGHSTVAVSASVRGQRHFQAGQSTRQLRLIVEQPLLHTYGLQDLLERPDGPLFCGRHDTAIRRLAATLTRPGNLLDTHIAALSLLAEQVRPLLPRTESGGRLRSAHQDKLLRAREILLSQFDHPLTIGYLSTAVGTNECTLKQGFRQLFGTSPHRMLVDIRMAKAWELLESGLHVSSVADKVGYRHLSSFSTAFERYYGRNPKTVKG